MGFILILALTTLSIAGSAAFFSIYGLANIFEGAFWPVVLMASSLEAGKLVAASFVYRYWKAITVIMKSYLILAIIVLMMITSAGIFGYLSAAYQQDTLPLKEMQSRIVLFDERKTEIESLKQERINQRARLDAQIDAIPGNHSTNRRKMRESQKEERAQIDRDLKRYVLELQSVTDEQHKLKNALIQQEAHTGPIVFIAKAFDYKVDDATKWMILLIIFAFDPLAVILTIGTNIAILKRRSDLGLDIPTKLATSEPTNISPIEDESTIFANKENEQQPGPPPGPPVDDGNEPSPSVTSIDDIHSNEDTVEKNDRQPEDEVNPIVDSIEQLQSMLASINEKSKLTEEEQIDKQQIEQLLRRKHVTNQLRNPTPQNKKHKVSGGGIPFKKQSR